MSSPEQVVSEHVLVCKRGQGVQGPFSKLSKNEWFSQLVKMGCLYLAPTQLCIKKGKPIKPT